MYSSSMAAIGSCSSASSNASMPFVLSSSPSFRRRSSVCLTFGSQLLSSTFQPFFFRHNSIFKLFTLQDKRSRKNELRTAGFFVCSLKKLSEVQPVSLSGEAVDPTVLPAAPGIYAVFDKQGELQFLGISRRVSSSLLTHIRDLPELCDTAKVAVIDAPERSALVDGWKQWMEEYVELTGKVPPGNEAGVTTWTAKKPRQGKPDIRLTPGRHVKLTIPLEQLIDKVVKENEVVAFIKGSRTAPQCGFSYRVLTILNEQGVDYETLDVLDEEHNAGLREALKAYSEWPTIPQVFVRGEFIGGADIMDELVSNGKIKALFQNSS